MEKKKWSVHLTHFLFLLFLILIRMDRRRVQGPETSVVPFINRQPKVDIKGRLDGRKKEDIRPIFLRTGLVEQASGSAYIEMGNTKVVCAIYGPKQTKQGFSERGKLNCEFKFASFSCQKRKQFQYKEKEFSQMIIQAITPCIQLEKLPKSVIDIYITVLENDGLDSCLSSAMIVTSTALANANIHMYDLVTAISLNLINNELWMDVTMEESLKSSGSLLVAYMPSLGEISHVIFQGFMNWNQLNQGLEQCIDICKKIHLIMIQALTNNE
jgi:exosome complex component MTR3